MQFESANPSVVRSIKQRDLLNTWLRIYSREQRLPRIQEYQPSRFDDELPDLLYYAVEDSQTSPRLIIQSGGSRTISAYGGPGRGRYLDEYLGPKLAAAIVPVYRRCVNCALPVYTIAEVGDSHGRLVACERLLLPFSDNVDVTHVIASLKTISEDGGFDIKNLIRQDALPIPKLSVIIDRELFHRVLARVPADDVIDSVGYPKT